MVIVVVTVFLLSNTGNFIFRIMRERPETENSFFISFTYFALMLNPGVNIMIYAYFNKKFQYIFFYLFCSTCQRNNVENDFPMKKMTTTSITTLKSRTNSNPAWTSYQIKLNWNSLKHFILRDNTIWIKWIIAFFTNISFYDNWYMKSYVFINSYCLSICFIV